MMETLQIAAAFFLSLILVYITIPAIVRLSKAKKLYDYPNKRKLNKCVIPNMGGAALFLGISVATLLSIYKMQFQDLRYIMVALIIMFYTGIKDDILLITPQKKFILQIITAVVLVVPGNIRLTDFHGIFGIDGISYVPSSLINILVIVSIINSINLIDGIDGLAAGLGILITGFFSSAFFFYRHYEYAILGFAILGGLIPFFIFNVFSKKNKIFMGDSGSLVLGTLFAILVIKYNEFALNDPGRIRYYSPALSMAIISVPLFDMIRVFFMRIINNKSPFSPDKNHIHHKFLRLGYSHLKSTLIIVTVNLMNICLIATFRNLEIHILLTILVIMGFLFDLILDYKLQKRKSHKILPIKLKHI